MSSGSLSSVDLHRLVLLYLAVAYEADDHFDPAEHKTVLRLLRRWMPEMTVDEANGVVDTALKALRSGMTEGPETLARAVGTNLTPELRRRVLSNLGQVARADGYLSINEAHVIRRVRAALETTSVDS
jgi:uncharacterized tellurite resistance protein B-like protein